MTQNGPALWSKILERMPPGAIVAGGAVRDYLLHVEPKDIDVFCLTTRLEIPEGFTAIDGRDARAEEYAAMPSISIVVRGKIEGHTVDLIGVDSSSFPGSKLVETFDFGLTRSWFDGTTHETDEAFRDRMSKTVTLLKGDRPMRAAQRFARFFQRMGGGWSYREVI